MSGPDPMARCGSCVWFTLCASADEYVGSCTFDPTWVRVGEEHRCSHFKITNAGLRAWLDANRKR